jgi:hypothetical protein
MRICCANLIWDWFTVGVSFNLSFMSKRCQLLICSCLSVFWELLVHSICLYVGNRGLMLWDGGKADFEHFEIVVRNVSTLMNTLLVDVICSGLLFFICSSSLTSLSLSNYHFWSLPRLFHCCIYVVNWYRNQNFLDER